MISLAQFCKCYPKSFEKKIPEKSSVVAPIMSALYSGRREQASAPCEQIQEMQFVRKDTSFEVKTDGAFCRSSYPSASAIAAAV
jgi:hypothetical protein